MQLQYAVADILADAQADLSIRWAHSHFVGSVTRWLNSGLQVNFPYAGTCTTSTSPEC